MKTAAIISKVANIISRPPSELWEKMLVSLNLASFFDMYLDVITPTRRRAAATMAMDAKRSNLFLMKEITELQQSSFRQL